MGEILNFIKDVGFPIFMCLIMAWYIKENSNNHKEEVKGLSEALNNNTLALQHLADSLGIGGNENDN